jgi:chemotaxis-related protein WspD
VSTSELDATDSAVLDSRPGVPGKEDEAVEICACWNQIGVQGDGTCLELRKFVHCRNCPVYSNAVVQLLDRPLLPQCRHEWTEHFAQPKQLVAPATGSALVFRLNAEWLALPTQVFQEVAEPRLVHSLPRRRHNTVLGLVNIHGELLICVSLGCLLGIERAPAGPTLRRSCDRLLVANWHGNRLVFPADEVRGLYRFRMSELKEPPATLAKSSRSYTQGLLPWQGRTVGFLDADLLFSSFNRSLT